MRWQLKYKQLNMSTMDCIVVFIEIWIGGNMFINYRW